MEFNVKEAVDNAVNYLKNYAKKYVIGMSGGKDSLVVCKLATLAVGTENVLGLIMPNGVQDDLDDAIECCKICGINYHIINIKDDYDIFEDTLDKATGTEKNRVSETNDPACIRTNNILAMTRRWGGVMLNTCNRPEDCLGYSTFGGDSMGGVGVLCKYTVTEVLAIGDYLGLPYERVHKEPKDGMCGTSDEINLSRQLNIPNFKYARFDKLIRGEKHNFTEEEVQRLIERYKKNRFKIRIIRVEHQDVNLYDFFEELEIKEAKEKVKFNIHSEIVGIKDLEELLKLDGDECKGVLKYYINNYYKEQEEEKKEMQRILNRYMALGIPEKALYSKVRETANCEALIFNEKDKEWKLDCEKEIPISWSSDNLLEVLLEIEEKSKSKIVRFGSDDVMDFADSFLNVYFGKVSENVYLDEGWDSFNLQLENGEYYHLYFDESK